MSTEREAVQRVIITDIRMSFGSMVVFMVKWAIASVPAVLILLVLGSLFTGLLHAILR
ncbi:hypothetical protein [Thioalbus denitrificans]|jgi:hypothetical protein|uniref:Uncharacterized protein n=1 Tax=Thioalbus denitrificans TaxID=547122 RepID=A0A369CMV8_9GAMM|nr:hypothetical protein [Thioalbus denitrificans]RCX33184.1 hypothetical protein DFQ59_101483 [Thioalbus denitrificans]